MNVATLRVPEMAEAVQGCLITLCGLQLLADASEIEPCAFLPVLHQLSWVLDRLHEIEMAEVQQ